MVEKISVLIPTYNREQFIDQALVSIRKQTYKDIIILIYDDGSSDGTIDRIKHHQETDDRIFLLQGEKNKGVGYARNVLLHACKTEYACWMDSDDVSNVHRIEKQVEMLEDNDLVFTGKSRIISSKWMYKPVPYTKDQKAFATLMFRVNKQIKFKNIKLGGEDWNWTERMRMIYTEECIVPFILYHIRSHADRIGQWKRKIRSKFKSSDLRNLSYEEMINLYIETYGE